MENKKTSKIVTPAIALIVVVGVIVFLYLTFNGQHNKMFGGFETNIPKPDTVKGDSVKIKSLIQMRDNNGKIEIK